MQLQGGSIGKKFLFPSVAISVILFTVLGVFITWRNAGEVRSLLDARGKSVVDLLMRQGGDAIENFDFQYLDVIAQQARKDPDIRYITFFDETGAVLSGDKTKPSDSGVLLYSRKIKDSDGKALGVVTIGYSDAAYKRTIRDTSAIMGVGLVLTVTLFVFGLSMLLKLLITDRIREAAGMLEEMAGGKGDLTHRMKISRYNDEMNLMASSFNTFMDNLQEMVRTIQEGAGDLASASTQLSTSSDDLDTMVKEQNTHTGQVAAAMSEMSQTIIEVARNAGDAADASQKATTTAQTGKGIVENSVVGMLKIASSVGETADTIGELGESSDQIGTIIQVIDDIADQTNLLALNAAIEAARAGEQGRGFAVVADEVRKLAERTSAATKEISGMVIKIQDDTNRSVEGMRQGSEEVQGGVTLSEQAKDSLDQIVKASNTARDMVQQIAAAAEEQSAATDEVSMNMESILRFSDHFSQSTAQIKNSAQDLDRLSENLKNKTGQFKV